MSSIPPNSLSSIIQISGAQQRASEARQKETNADRLRSRDTAFADKLHDVIENAERDSSVHADAEGAGGQGRNSSEHPAEHAPIDESAPADAATDAGGSLDIQA